VKLPTGHFFHAGSLICLVYNGQPCVIIELPSFYCEQRTRRDYAAETHAAGDM